MRIIGGSARGRHLKTKKGLDTRPTADRVRESLFNILAPDIAGSFFLDVFAGFGGVGIEALSRGAEKCVFIEMDRDCVTIIKKNLAVCGLESRGEVVQQEAETALKLLHRKKALFDLIFFDPPYGSPQLQPALLASTPLLAVNGYVVVEHQRGDMSWYPGSGWRRIREKTYGDTALTIMIPVVAGIDADSPDAKGGNS
jgi:16S rRNA (guanine966-N2)-methyltransferase